MGVGYRQELGREGRDAGGAGEKGLRELRLIGHGREVRFLSTCDTNPLRRPREVT